MLLELYCLEDLVINHTAEGHYCRLQWTMSMQIPMQDLIYHSCAGVAVIGCRLHGEP